jgi:hypothetical protein
LKGGGVMEKREELTETEKKLEALKRETPGFLADTLDDMTDILNAAVFGIIGLGIIFVLTCLFS